MSRLLMVLLLICGTATSGCKSRTADVQCDGSSTVYPISEAVAEEFAEVAPELRVTIGKSGTGAGVKKFASGQIDICNASRKIKPEELEACAANQIEPVEFTIAFDGIAMVVHPENTWCSSLTVAQLAEIFRLDSAIEKWSDLNPDWPQEPINLYGPGPDSGTYDYFNEVILGEDTQHRVGYTQSEDDNVLVLGVEVDKYALGYFGYAYYSTNSEKLKLLGVDKGDGNAVQPSTETVRANTYQPLSRPLFIYARKDALARPAVAQYVQFFLDNCSKLAADVQYVAVDEATATANAERLKAITSGSASTNPPAAE